MIQFMFIIFCCLQRKRFNKEVWIKGSKVAKSNIVVQLQTIANRENHLIPKSPNGARDMQAIRFILWL